MARTTQFWRLILTALIVCLLQACGSTSGLINKVKRGDTVYENSCTKFQEDVNRLIEANKQPNVLAVSQYENSAYDYFYLEPGQFTMQGDTLLFRLKEDLNYAGYIDPNTAIHVNLSFKAPADVAERMIPREREIGTIVVDRGYYLRNSRPFFVYQIPLRGMPVAGRQLMMSFSIVSLNKGVVDEYHCETENKPIGTAMPACCTAAIWEAASLQTIADIPALNIQPDTFAYAGFRAMLDIAFQDNVIEAPGSLPASALQSLLANLKGMDYHASRINITAYPAILGDPALNLGKAKLQASTVYETLTGLNQGSKIAIEHKAEGPDWELVGNLVQKSSSFTNSEKDQVVAITRGSAGDASKIAKLSLLDFYQKLKDNILNKTRHVRTEVRFDYNGELATIGRYKEVLSLWDPALESQVARRFEAQPYSPGDDISQAVARIDKILTQKASANVYAMRATYMQAKKDYRAAIGDLEKAARLEPGNASYTSAIRAYKILFAGSYSMEERLTMLDEYDRFTRDNPSDRSLFLNRAMLMEKCGLTTLSVNEYGKLFEGVQVSAKQLNNRGVALLKAHRLRDARIDFEQSISRDSRLAEPHFNLAVLYAYEGLERKSAEHLAAAIKRDPRFRNLIFNNPAFSILADTPRFDQFKVKN
ncbi:MAG: tetratricopeptide repeat protein [Bacteroidia bacterium]